MGAEKLTLRTERLNRGRDHDGPSQPPRGKETSSIVICLTKVGTVPYTVEHFSGRTACQDHAAKVEEGTIGDDDVP